MTNPPNRRTYNTRVIKRSPANTSLSSKLQRDKNQLRILQNKLHTQKLQIQALSVSNPVNNKRAVSKRTLRRKKANMRAEYQPVSLSQRNWMRSAYAMCRMNPFSSKGSLLGTPLGNVRRIVSDHRQLITFKVGSSGGFNIAIVPTLPYPVWIQTPTVDTTFSITCNGLTVSPSFHSGDYKTYYSYILNEYSNLVVTLNNSSQQYDTAQPYLSFSRARFVSSAWNLTYTGSTVENSGVLTVNRSAITAFPPIPNVGSFTVRNSMSGTDKTFNTNQVMIRPINFAPNFQAGNDTTRTMRLSEGANGRMAFIGREHEWSNFTDSLTFLTANDEEDISLLLHNEQGTESVMSHWPHVAFIDDEWGVTTLSVSGATEGTTFILDTIFCVEGVPNTNSGVYSLAKQPKINSNEVSKVDTALNADSVAKPGSINPNSFTTASSVLSTMASIGSNLLPAVASAI